MDSLSTLLRQFKQQRRLTDKELALILTKYAKRKHPINPQTINNIINDRYPAIQKSIAIAIEQMVAEAQKQGSVTGDMEFELQAKTIGAILSTTYLNEEEKSKVLQIFFPQRV